MDEKERPVLQQQPDEEKHSFLNGGLEGDDDRDDLAV